MNKRQMRFTGIAIGTWLVAIAFLVLIYMWKIHMIVAGPTPARRTVMDGLYVLPFLTIAGGYLIMKRTTRQGQ